jgi:hypothetical protein
MVIAEALNEIKDLEKRRRDIQTKLRGNIYILPDLEEGEKPDSLEVQMAELQEVVAKISDLRMRLINTNVATKVEVADAGGLKVTMTLVKAIKHIENCRYYETQLNEIADAMENKGSRFYDRGNYMSQGEPIKLAPNFQTTSKVLRLRSQAHREDARRTEQALIKANWSTPIV